MRHKKFRYQLNRFTSWKQATLRSIARNTLIHQSIKTTEQKAKATKPLIEELISLAKANTLSAKREAFKILGSHSLVSHLFKEIGPRFNQKKSGFTRIINLGARRGDNANLVVLELTEIKKKEVKKPKKEAKNEKEPKTEKATEGSAEEIKPRTETAVKEEKRHETKKPPKKFMGGIRNIFKKERDSL